MPPRRLTRNQARRIALAAQGFARPRPEGPVTMRQVQQVITRLGQFQIDSINVVERAHYLPLYSRLGPYDRALLDRAFGRGPRRMFEYWGHAASLLDVTLWPAVQWRMEANAVAPWRTWDALRERHPELGDQVLAEVARRGPVTARGIEFEEVRRRDRWGWNWSSVKVALEHHFSAGRITSAGRTASFERLYDIPERVIPAAVFQQPALGREEAILHLTRRAATALGVASIGCLTDYFRLSKASTQQAVRELEASGELVPAEVEGWRRPLWLWHEAQVPRRVQARALLSPFDSLVFERTRLHELFDFFYRIEIYVPEPKRQFGYYVYAFLLGDQFVARVDLKADRARGVLVVKASWLEPGRELPAEQVARELAEELAELGRWTGCPGVQVEPHGDLAEELSRATLTSH